MTNQGLKELDDGRLRDLKATILLERKRDKYTHIPEELWQYSENAIAEKSTDDSLLKAIAEWGIDEIFSNLNRLFKKACEITGFDLNRLVASLDFKPKDVAKGRIDSLLAELRAIFFLNGEKQSFQKFNL